MDQKTPLSKRFIITCAAGIIILAVFFFIILMVGAVKLPAGEILNVLMGKETSSPYVSTIVLESRLPMAIGSLCCGVTLSLAGLMMQTIFHNPLAGPSVLGISSGASLGVALIMLSASGIAGGLTVVSLQSVISIVGALAGGIGTILILYVFSSMLKSSLTLLIVGIMISYLCSSVIALLNYFSPSDEIRSFLVWGLGSFDTLRLETSVWLAILSALSVVPVIFFIKPLNALLLGERYLESVGYKETKFRGCVLLTTGLLVAVPTAFCGPIGFIGLIVPHLCRMIFRSSNHLVLIPGCIIGGAVVSLGCAVIEIIPSAELGILPINVITPLIGVPVIIYLLLNREKLLYF